MVLSIFTSRARRAGQRIVNNLNLHEVSGSLGDLGTLVPIMISLAVAGQINLTSTLWFGGIWNIVSGLLFQVPMCVQPMKAIAATVLASNMTIQENMAAGLGCAALIFFLGATRTIHIVGAYTPGAVVRGIQLGTAVSLLKKATSLVSSLKWTITVENWADNYTWVLLSFIFVMICYRTRIPSALILIIIGIIFALIRMYVTDKDLGYQRPVAAGHYPDTVIRPTPEEFRDGFVNAGLGQVPLTALNSVIAVAALIDDLFPEQHTGTSKIAMSIGVMNLIGCWFGSMPFCHGSGGLAGQYRFGARSEVSIILLGFAKLFLGILFGSSLVGLLQLFPKSILAVMLFISAIELGSACRVLNLGVQEDWKQRDNWVILLVTMGALTVFSNDGIGFLAGMGAAILLSMQRLGIRGWCLAVIDGLKKVPHYLSNENTLRYSPTDNKNVSSYGSTNETDQSSSNDPENASLPKPAAAPHS